MFALSCSDVCSLLQMTCAWNLDLHVERLLVIVQIWCQAVNSGKFLLAELVCNCFWAGRAGSGGRKAATKDSC